MYLSWTKTVYGKRIATRLAKAFSEQGLTNRVERIVSQIGNENPRPSQWYMILVHNPGIESGAFAAQCEAIYNNMAR